MYRIYCCLLIALLSQVSSLLAINPVQSPHFKIITEEVSIEAFPLISTKVRSKMAGPIADVEVSQTYRNDGSVPIEAVYVFPGSTKSAVYAMEMQIGNRTINAKIQEKQKARKMYEEAKVQGKRTSLLEQQKPNVFTMNVANILPGEEVKLVMKYTEFLVPTDGVYSFVFPTVVGPRYSNGVNTPEFVSGATYLPEGSITPYDVDFHVQVKAPVVIQAAESKTHQLKVITHDDGFYSGKIENPQSAGNRDFIFDYRLADKSIATGTMLYDHGDEKFFLSIIEPQVKPNIDEIAPREFMFIVDVSGSMFGFPLDVSKQLMSELLTKLRPIDYFNVLLFAGSSKKLSPQPMLATESNIKQALKMLSRQRGGGSTQLLPAIKTAMSSPKVHENGSRSLVIITDGYIHVEEACFEYIEEHLNESNFFAFGIGSSVNRFLMEGIAHIGRGEAFVITEKKEAKEQAKKFINYIQSPVMTNIEVFYNDFDAYDFYPKQIPDLLAQRPIYVFGKYTDSSKGSIVISGKTSDGEYKKEINLSESQKTNEPAIRYLWAREKLKYLSDYQSISHSEKYKKDIVDIGLQYNLMSKYTSFLAIDEQTVTSGNETVKVRQPTPLPQGVLNYAIGFEMGAEGFSEPEEKTSDRIVFVHVDSKLNDEVNQNIRDFVKNICQHADDEARELLEGNVLTIELSPADKIVQISDRLQVLTDDQIRILEIQLMDLHTLVEKNSTISITIAWL